DFDHDVQRVLIGPLK
ncbi:hypothetical protein A2U01_0064017, partial [Trifolium medium]|nr:hypothetical protein [Trifolium medium]